MLTIHAQARAHERRFDDNTIARLESFCANHSVGSYAIEIHKGDRITKFAIIRQGKIVTLLARRNNQTSDTLRVDKILRGE